MQEREERQGPVLDRVYSVPVNFGVDTSKFDEIQWRILRVECEKHGCRWKFDCDGKPQYPRDCSDECRTYIEHSIDLNHDRQDNI